MAYMLSTLVLDADCFMLLIIFDLVVNSNKFP